MSQWIEQEIGVYATPDKSYYAVWVGDCFQVHRMGDGDDVGEIVIETDSLDDALAATQTVNPDKDNWLVIFGISLCMFAGIVIALAKLLLA